MKWLEVADLIRKIAFNKITFKLLNKLLQTILVISFSSMNRTYMANCGSTFSLVYMIATHDACIGANDAAIMLITSITAIYKDIKIGRRISTSM